MENEKIADQEEFEQVNKFGMGQPNIAYAKYFSGASFLNALTEHGKYPIFAANVTFEPGCRNNYHIHHAKSGGGQIKRRRLHDIQRPSAHLER